MQSYIGVFYHALLHRNITTLRQVLIQRLVISEVEIDSMASFCLMILLYLVYFGNGVTGDRESIGKFYSIFVIQLQEIQSCQVFLSFINTSIIFQLR